MWFVLFGAGTEALSQTHPAEWFQMPAAPSNLVSSPPTIFSKPAVSASAAGWRWAPLVKFRANLPSLSYAGISDTQIQYFGGALQNYLNVSYPDSIQGMYGIAAPFGATAVLPLARGRAEIFGGAAGVFVPFATPYSRPNSWLTQASAGVRMHLDPGYHLWLGTTAYYLTDFAGKKRQWAYATADLTVRFGR